MADAPSYLDGLFGHAIKADGTLLSQRSFINVIGPGISATDNPTANATEIRSTGLLPSLSETGHGVVSTSGFINEGAASAGIWGGYSTASEAQLQGWDGTTRTLAHGSANVLLYQLLATTSAKWRVNGTDRIVADGTNSTIASPSAAATITVANTTIEATASARVALIVSTDRVVAAATKTSVLSPSNAVGVEANDTRVAITGDVAVTGAISATAPVVLPSYIVSGVPSAATYARGMIYVPDEAGGPVPAFSDGTNWRRVTDRNIIS
jgi:hypothetical protein